MDNTVNQNATSSYSDMMEITPKTRLNYHDFVTSSYDDVGGGESMIQISQGRLSKEIGSYTTASLTDGALSLTNEPMEVKSSDLFGMWLSMVLGVICGFVFGMTLLTCYLSCLEGTHLGRFCWLFLRFVRGFFQGNTSDNEVTDSTSYEAEPYPGDAVTIAISDNLSSSVEVTRSQNSLLDSTEHKQEGIRLVGTGDENVRFACATSTVPSMQVELTKYKDIK